MLGQSIFVHLLGLFRGYAGTILMVHFLGWLEEALLRQSVFVNAYQYV